MTHPSIRNDRPTRFPAPTMHSWLMRPDCTVFLRPFVHADTGEPWLALMLLVPTLGANPVTVDRWREVGP